MPITNVVDSGGGSYTISWIVPAGAQSYRLKWGPKQIVDWIGFDPIKNVFTGDPVIYAVVLTVLLGFRLAWNLKKATARA